MDNNKLRITFDKSATAFFLEILDKGVDAEGYIVEKSDKNQRVLSFEGKEILAEDLGGVKKGSEVFVEDNVVSLIKFAKEMK